MPQHHAARFLASQFFQLRGHRDAHASQSLDVARTRRLAQGVAAANGLGPFGDHDDTELGPEGLAPTNVGRHLLEVIRNFRHQDHVCAARHAAVQRDPAGIAPHHLDDHDALVRLGRRVQAVNGQRREVHGGVKAEATSRADNVVVDCLGDAHEGNALQVELMSDAERAIAADDHEGVQPHLVEGLDHLVRVVDLALWRVNGILKRIAMIRGTENGAAESQDAGDISRRQHPRARGVEQAVKAVFEANDFNSGVVCGLDDRPDDGVEAWGVAAAGEDADLLNWRHVTQLYERMLGKMVDGTRIELVTSALRTLRSPS